MKKFCTLIFLILALLFAGCSNVKETLDSRVSKELENYTWEYSSTDTTYESAYESDYWNYINDRYEKMYYEAAVNADFSDSIQKYIYLFYGGEANDYSMISLIKAIQFARYDHPELELMNMEHEFGIVPFPKFDSGQKDYMTLYPEDGYLFALPSLIPNPERTFNIIEDMNYYSSFIIEPIWYDLLLARRYARDDESEETLRTLNNNRVYDIGLYCDIGGIRSNIIDAEYIPTNSNIARRYEIFKKRIQDKIDLFNSNFS